MERQHAAAKQGLHVVSKYEYRGEDGELLFTKVVAHPATECEKCGGDVRDKGSFYACNVCGHRGNHSIAVYPGGKEDD